MDTMLLYWTTRKIPILAERANHNNIFGDFWKRSVKNYFQSISILVIQSDRGKETVSMPNDSLCSHKTKPLILEFRGVKRNNGVFIIPLFLLKNFRYSIIPAQKVSLFHYSCPKIFIIPLFLPNKHTLFHYSKNKISVILIPLFLFSPRNSTDAKIF